MSTTAPSPEGVAPTSKDRPSNQTLMDTSPIDLGCIDFIQVLNEHGEVRADLDPGLPDDELRSLHRAMVLSRTFDARMLTMQRQGEMGTFAPNLGQEACMVGQVWPLESRDWFCPSYRSFGAQIHRGWPMDHLFRLWAGYQDGFPPPAGINDMPFSIVVGSHVLPAVGIAMGLRRRNATDCVVVNFGDGAASQGAVAEAFNFAAVDKAPVIFVCENNGWAISTPSCYQYATDHLAGRGVGYGLPSVRVDGNDILGMIVVMRQAVERARSGGGPTLVEAITYRLSLHTTADDPTVYRAESESEPWKHRCPIARLETYLDRRGALTAEAAGEVVAACEAEVLEARSRFRTQAQVDPRGIFDHLYDTLPPELEAQREAYLRRLDRKGVS